MKFAIRHRFWNVLLLWILLAASSSLAGTFSISASASGSATRSINVSNSGGSWDSVVIVHREPSPLADALVGISTNSADLKSTGAALSVGSNASFSVPEAGVYWVYAKKASTTDHPDSIWAASRVEFAPDGGRLSTWYDAGGQALYIRLVVPASLSASANVQISVGLSGSASTQIYSGAFSAMAGGVTASVGTSSPYVAWIRVAASAIPDSVDVVFPSATEGTKDIALHASRPARDANLEGAAHLLERIITEVNNPLIKTSTTTYTSSIQLAYWSALVDKVPTWSGYTELLRDLLTKKKGSATEWSDDVPKLDAGIVTSVLSTIMTESNLVARNTQQNLSGPVYYGAYTRATLDDDLHFPLREGELLQILWQGSIDLYYYDGSNPTDSVLTKLSLPSTTTVADPYLATKQLVLAQGSDILKKIQNSGLWVRGVDTASDAHFTLALKRVYAGSGIIVGSVNTETVAVDMDVSALNHIDGSPVRIQDSDGDEINAVDTFAYIGCGESNYSLYLPEGITSDYSVNAKGSMVLSSALSVTAKGYSLDLSAPCEDNLSVTTLDDFASTLFFANKLNGEKNAIRILKLYAIPYTDEVGCRDYLTLPSVVACDSVATSNYVMDVDSIGEYLPDSMIASTDANGTISGIQINSSQLLRGRPKAIFRLRTKGGGNFPKKGNQSGVSVDYLQYAYSPNGNNFKINAIRLRAASSTSASQPILLSAPNPVELVIHSGAGAGQVWLTTDINTQHRNIDVYELSAGADGKYSYGIIYPQTPMTSSSKIGSVSYVYGLTQQMVNVVKIRCNNCLEGDQIAVQISKFDNANRFVYQSTTPMQLTLYTIAKPSDLDAMTSAFGRNSTDLQSMFTYGTKPVIYSSFNDAMYSATQSALQQTETVMRKSKQTEHGGWITKYNGQYLQIACPIVAEEHVGVSGGDGVQPQLGKLFGVYHSHPTAVNDSVNALFSGAVMGYIEIAYAEYLKTILGKDVKENFACKGSRSGGDYSVATELNVPLTMATRYKFLDQDAVNVSKVYMPNSNASPYSVSVGGVKVSVNPYDYLHPKTSAAIARLDFWRKVINSTPSYWGTERVLNSNRFSSGAFNGIHVPIDVMLAYNTASSFNGSLNDAARMSEIVFVTKGYSDIMKTSNLPANLHEYFVTREQCPEYQ